MILGILCEQTMRLESITQVVQTIRIEGSERVNIEGIAYDSRQVKPGYMYIAIKGEHHDGADYIGEAIGKGAVAVVSERHDIRRPGVTHIHVDDARLALAEIAAAFHDDPSQRLDLIGITGTNGKTTTSFMAKAILAYADRHPGLIGSVQYEVGLRVIPSSRTTPEASDIQHMLSQMVDAGCKSGVLEVSSHALVQKRVWGIDFDVGVFTNLTQDHLDYHGSMDAYFNAKAQLFRGLGTMQKKAVAVINIDDPWGLQLANTGGSWAQEVTFGRHPAASVRADDILLDPEGSTFQMTTPWGNTRVRLNLLGMHNISNALAAAAACGALGVDPRTIAEALKQLSNVPGRLEKIAGSNGVKVYVDYAHTEDALSHALSTLRETTQKRLTVVFGCGGDRDKDKRSRMGCVASSYADQVILTTDNPRSEDPQDIIDQIQQGFQPRTQARVIINREEAIREAICDACSGDIVLVAGKGHETYQEFAHTVVPFDDREICRKWLASRS